jgi:hypothetical protein
MRAAPTATVLGTWTVSNCSQPATTGVSAKAVSLYTTVTVLGPYLFQTTTGAALQLDARM